MELTLSQIKDAALSEQIFEEAQKLVENNAVVSLEIDETSNPLLYIIQGVIRQDKKYAQVSLSIERDDVELKAHICTCSAHNAYQPCVHVIALLIKVYENIQKQKEQNKQSEQKQDENFLQVLNTYEQQMIFSTLSLNMQTKVHLEPVLEIKDSIMTLTLKIGTNKMYRVKDIQNFLDDMVNNVHKSYGKELSFYHHRNSFDEESKVLLSFLMKHRYDYLYYQSQQKYQHIPNARNLCLSKNAVDELMELYQDTSMYERIKENRLMEINFRKHAPSLSLYIRKRLDDSYELSLSETIRDMIHGEDQLVILMNQTYYHCDYEYTKNCYPLLDTLMHHGSLIIDQNHMPSFYNTILLSVEEFITINGDDISNYAPQPLECKLYLDAPNYSTITAKLEYCYGNMTYNALTDTAYNNARNVHEEVTARILLSRYMHKVKIEEGLFYIEHNLDEIYEFLSKGYEQLNAICSIYATEVFKKMQIRKKAKVAVGIRIDSDLLHLDFDTDDFPKDELSDLLKAYRLNKKFYRMKNGSFVDIEESAFHDLSSMLQGLRVKESDIENGETTLPLYRSLFLDQSLKDTHYLKVERDQSFKTIIRDMKNVEDCDYQIPKHLKGTLRNYQKVGFRWLKTMSNYGFGGILADDMGIGKTIQVITLLSDLKIQDPKAYSLVVCPTSLMLNWESEIQKFAPELSCCLLVGSGDQRKELLKKENIMMYTLHLMII